MAGELEGAEGAAGGLERVLANLAPRGAGAGANGGGVEGGDGWGGVTKDKGG